MNHLPLDPRGEPERGTRRPDLEAPPPARLCVATPPDAWDGPPRSCSCGSRTTYFIHFFLQIHPEQVAVVTVFASDNDTLQQAIPTAGQLIQQVVHAAKGE